MNQIMLIGNLATDVKYTQRDGSNNSAWFRIAVNRGYGEKRITDYIPVTAWGRTADNCAKYISKGSKVAVVGRITNRQTDAQDGRRNDNIQVSAFEVEFLGGKNDAEAEGTLDDQDIPF